MTPPDAPRGPGLPGSLGERMEADHRRLDELWDRASEAWPRDPAQARGGFTEFRDGLLRHIRAEEEVLFPFFEANAGPSARELLDRLRDEHRSIRAALSRLLESVDAGEADLTAAETDLQDALWSHNAREEGQLYPWFGAERAGAESEPVALEIERRLASNGRG